MPNILYLCAGLQSSGSTLISWCFLQRPDMNGVLDANNDELASLTLPPHISYAWIKTTISSFRLSEQVAHYQDLGWTVRPLLICRDVREAYASLRTKEYGRNGTTAEDPPLRLRFRRFREDWDLFHDNDWPILRYDEFLQQPEQVLRQTCSRLELPWDHAMLSWPKPRAAILNTRHGNETFRRNIGASLWASLKPAPYMRQRLERLRMPEAELEWLEQEFARFNHVNGYPAHVAMAPASALEEARSIPTYRVARRYKWKLHQTPLKYLLARIAGWFHDDAARPAKPLPAPVNRPFEQPKPSPVSHPGDDSRTDLGEYAAAGI